MGTCPTHALRDMRLVVAIPELGADNFGHHDDLVAAVRTIEREYQTQGLVLTHATRPGSALELPWFTEDRHADRRGLLFFEEMRRYLEAQPSRPAVCTFVYNCDRSRLNQLVFLATRFPNFMFVANLLFPGDWARKSWRGDNPRNVLLTSELDTTLALLRRDYPGIKSEKLPLYVPQLSRVEPTVGLKDSKPKSQLLLLGSRDPKRGYQLALNALGRRKDILRLVDSITAKIGAKDDGAWVVRMTNKKLGQFGESEIEFVEGHVDALRLSKILESSSIVILPYSPRDFRYQASGMFMHALQFNVIPIVLNGTWMAQELRWLGLTELIAQDSAKSLASVIGYVLNNQATVRTKVDAVSHLIKLRYDRQSFLKFLSSLDGLFEKQTN